MGRRRGKAAAATRASAIVSFVVAGLVACGGAPKPATVAAGQPAPPAPDRGAPAAPRTPAAEPCDLLTQGEIAEEIGADVDPPQAVPAACRYATRKGPVIVVLQREAALGRFEALKAELSGGEVRDLGDRAFLARGVIAVVKGPTYFEIKMPEGGSANTHSLIGMARRAAARA